MSHVLKMTFSSPTDHFNLRLCAKYGFQKPNDKRALDLMNAAAKVVVGEVQDITIAYGVSDEYRYVSAVDNIYRC